LKRGKLETIVTIMGVLGEDNPSRRTEIMHKANLNYKALLWYLELLEASGMIKSIEHREGRTNEKYVLTREGADFLGTIKRALGRLAIAETC